MSDSDDPYIPVGRVLAAYGVKGWFKLRSDTQPVTNILNYSPWYLRVDQHWQVFTPKHGRVHGKGLVAQLVECGDRDCAEALAGTDIAIHSQQLAELGENEFYWRDLIGLNVHNHHGELLGTVRELLETGANDVLVVSTDGKDILIPFVMHHYIQKVDLASGEIHVEWERDY